MQGSHVGRLRNDTDTLKDFHRFRFSPLSTKRRGHLEAYMRSEHGALDRLSRDAFRAEVLKLLFGHGESRLLSISSSELARL